MNDLWNFEIFFFYQRAIDIAKKRNHQKIVELLSKKANQNNILS